MTTGHCLYAQKPLAPLPALKPLSSDTPPAAQPTESVSHADSAPAEVIASGVAAVKQLGDEVVLGRFQTAVDRMNPLWKERAAKRLGGVAELNSQLDNVARQMVEQGITMISFKPQGQVRSFEVGPGKKVEKVNGEMVETLIYQKWLLLVPTETKFRIIQPGAAKPIFIDSTGFQVAIATKAKNDWTFIDGSGLSVSELRSMFGTLPMDLVLPPLEKHESR
jgi:hypothetical protein